MPPHRRQRNLPLPTHAITPLRRNATPCRCDSGPALQASQIGRTLSSRRHHRCAVPAAPHTLLPALTADLVPSVKLAITYAIRQPKDAAFSNRAVPYPAAGTVATPNELQTLSVKHRKHSTGTDPPPHRPCTASCWATKKTTDNPSLHTVYHVKTDTCPEVHHRFHPSRPAYFFTPQILIFNRSSTTHTSYVPYTTQNATLFLSIFRSFFRT